MWPGRARAAKRAEFRVFELHQTCRWQCFSCWCFSVSMPRVNDRTPSIKRVCNKLSSGTTHASVERCRTLWEDSSVRRLSSEERLAKLSRLSPSSLTYVWAAAKIDSWRSNNRLVVSLFAERVATCNMTVGWKLKSTRSRESFATARSENRFWGEKLSPWSGQSAG